MQSNLYTLLTAVPAAVWNKVTKAASEKQLLRNTSAARRSTRLLEPSSTSLLFISHGLCTKTVLKTRHFHVDFSKTTVALKFSRCFPTRLTELYRQCLLVNSLTFSTSYWITGHVFGTHALKGLHHHCWVDGFPCKKVVGGSYLLNHRPCVRHTCTHSLHHHSWVDGFPCIKAVPCIKVGGCSYLLNHWPCIKHVLTVSSSQLGRWFPLYKSGPL